MFVCKFYDIVRSFDTWNIFALTFDVSKNHDTEKSDNDSENMFALSFDVSLRCTNAIRIRNWLFATLNLKLHFNSIEDVWQICIRRWSPQCKIAMKAAIVNMLATIWYARNFARFKGTYIHWKTAISLISSNVALSGNTSQATSNSSMTDFAILKKFNIHIHPPRAPQIKEEIWHIILNFLFCS